MSDRTTPRRFPFALVLGFVVFLAALVYLVGSSLVPRDAVEFALVPIVPRAAPPAGLVEDTVTIDARDQNAWRFFDFETGAPIEVPDTAGWDLAFRRFNVMVSGEARDLGDVTFTDVGEAPVLGYSATVFGRDTTNDGLSRWYAYNLLSHLLEPDGHVYVIRTRGGRYAKVEFLGYYCQGMSPGCVTLRYRYQGDGSRRLD